jgi:phospholipid transport system substrate-binding protein
MMRLLAVAATLLFAVGATAADGVVAPDVLVKNVTTEVLDVVREDKDIRNGNSQKTLELVETKVLPHFNFMRMTRLALGREGRQATPAQVERLAGEFRTLLVRTYSKALTEYRDQKIVFRPFSMKPEETDVRVRTEIRQTGGKPIAMDYYLEKTPAGWKVYDMEVGGVSLVTNYRSSFAQEVRAGGIDGLIRSLQDKNRSGEAVPAKGK